MTFILAVDSLVVYRTIDMIERYDVSAIINVDSSVIGPKHTVVVATSTVVEAETVYRSHRCCSNCRSG